MKLLFKYLKEKLGVFLLFILSCSVFALTFYLLDLPLEAVIYPSLLCLMFWIVFAVLDFLKVKKTHRNLEKNKLLPVSLISSLPEAKTIEGSDLTEIIMNIKQEMTESESLASKKYNDMIDYYTTWAHQIKTPIASMRLTLQNEDTPFSRQISRDLFKIEQYVEPVLMFIRLDSTSTDFVLRRYSVDEIVKQAVKKYKSEFIARKNRLKYDEINLSVVTDEKWLLFVVEQILSNALKYTLEGTVSIYRENDQLVIEDTGIGISEEDQPRIFEKGYTGCNGRADKKASGIGLYLCKSILENLGHGITITSEIDRGTKVKIDLSQKQSNAD